MRDGRHNSIWKFSRGAQRLGLKCVPGRENSIGRDDPGVPVAAIDNFRPYIRELATLVGFTAHVDEPIPNGIPAPELTGPMENNLTTPIDDTQEKGGGHMNKNLFDRKVHMSRLLSRASRRAVAFVLAAGMCAPWFLDAGAGARAFSLPVWPLQADHTVGGVNDTETISDSKDFPDVEIESNFVRDEFGFLTGYMELGLRVKTPVDENGDPKAFQALEVTLEYDTSFLTPVDWTLESNELVLSVNRPDGTPYPDADPVHRYGYFTEQLSTQKLAEISDGTAHSGWPETATDGVTPGVADNSRAMLSFEARSAVSADNKKVYFKEMTTIAVVHFKVDEEQMKNITIVKNGKDALGKDVYIVRYDGNRVDNIAQLQKEMADFAAADPNAAPVEELVRFANDMDMDLSGSAGIHHAGMALHYQGGAETRNIDGDDEVYKVEYYYTDVPLLADPVQEEYEGTTYTLNKPDTADETIPILAVNPALAAGAAGKYSYLTNLIFNDLVDPADPLGERTHINFTVTSKRSFVDTKDMLGNLTTIVYVDWDNTLLGTQIVPKRTDVRGLVSDHVAENFIYHDNDDSTFDPDLDINDPMYLVTSSADPTDLTPALDMVKSLERKENYRGKYSALAPAVDGTVDATTVDYITGQPRGEEYPLTNKLDYVFFKRPMTHPNKPDPTDPKYEDLLDPAHSGKDHPDYIADLADWEASDDWIQKTEDAADGGTGGTGGTSGGGASGVSASWDPEHPYAYGWAQCTQANFENVWTTMGTTGELADYAVDTDGVASVAYTGTEDFRFADLEKGFTEDTVFLKAVYEPGPELLTVYYRQITQPAYNKLNGRSAADGGAYSVSVTYERANVEGVDNAGAVDYCVRGSRRMRSPAVRQQTTTDLRWEENADLGVDHNLPNATVEEAAELLTKTTYANVAVENSEIVDIELVLSARSSKVDYFLIETYGANFVAGSQRSDTNFSRAGEDFTVDNYNYYVQGESEDKDPSGYYFNVVKYDERDGSHGFVLYGTLNNLLQKATQHNNFVAGETDNAIDQDSFYEYTPYGAINDANLRLDTNGTQAEMMNQLQFRQKLQDAAAAAAAHKGAADEADYWDSKLDCARLTYHQLQWFILEGALYSPAAADAKLLGWCHLHAACAATTSSKPDTWTKLMAAASGNQDDKDTISQLTAGEVENLFHLRSDGNATQYTSSSAFQADVVAAVDALIASGTAAMDLTWDQVQYYIDKKDADVNGDGTVDAADLAAAEAYGKETYWWYEGKTVPTDLSGVLSAADYANTSGRNALVNTIETAFDKIVNAAGEADRKDWIDLTENFVTDSVNGVLDVSFSDFRSKLTAAVAALGTAADWGDIQYHILHGSNPSHPADDAEIAGYWWHYGAQKVKDVATMLTAAKAGNAAWDAFSFADMQDTANYPELYFAKDFKGTPYTAAEFDSFKVFIKGLADVNTNLTWEQIQYLQVHSNDPVPPTTVNVDAAQNESNSYYWWKAGAGAPTMTHNTSTVQHMVVSMVDVSTLPTAIFRMMKNGIPAANSGLTGAISDNYRLVEVMPDGTVANFAAADRFEDGEIDSKLVATLNTLVTAAIAAGNGDEYTPPTLTWFQIQYALLNGGAYLPAGDTGLPTDSDYWWRRNDNNPNAVGVKTKFDEFLEYMYKIADENLTLAEVQANTDIINADVFKDASLNLRRTNTAYYTSSTIKTQAAKYLRDLAIAAYAGGYVDTANKKLTINWYQLQYGILFAKKGALVDAATAIAENYAWAPQHAKDAAGISLSAMMMARPMMVAPAVEPEVTVTTLEDGRILTQTTERIYNPETELNDKRITRVWVTREEENGQIRVTTRTLQELLTIDIEALEPVSVILKDETTVTWEDLPQTGEENTGDTYGVGDDAQLRLPENAPADTDATSEDNTNASVGTAVPSGPADEPADTDVPSGETVEPADTDATSEDNTNASVGTAVPSGPADEPADPDISTGETDEPDGTEPTDETPDEPATPPSSDLGSAEATFPPHGGEGSTTDTGDASSDNVGAAALGGPSDTPTGETDEPTDPDISTGETAGSADPDTPTGETVEPTAPEPAAFGGPAEEGSDPESASGEEAISSDPLTKLLLSKTLLSDQEAPASDFSGSPTPTPREATAMTIPQTNRITASPGTLTGTAPGLRGRSTLDPPLLRQSPPLWTDTCYDLSSTDSKFSTAWRAM